jgi:hypothetical protein
MVKLTQKSGDTCYQVLQDKFTFLKTQQLGFPKTNGQISTDNFTELIT